MRTTVTSWPCRYVVRLGEKYAQVAWWGKCPSTGGRCHQTARSDIFGVDDRWHPTRCARCGSIPYGCVERGGSSTSVYDTEDGKLHIGDIYRLRWAGHPACLDGCMYGWSNCAGEHLAVLLPNEQHWNLDSRADNCPLPEDHEHRCWVRHGTPPNLTIDKVGLTCSEGSGSIHAGTWLGWLRNGSLVAA